MKRRLLYRLGKILQRIGLTLEAPFTRLSSFGLGLWDRNCDCEMCQKRKEMA